MKVWEVIANQHRSRLDVVKQHPDDKGKQYELLFEYLYDLEKWFKDDANEDTIVYK